MGVGGGLMGVVRTEQLSTLILARIQNVARRDIENACYPLPSPSRGTNAPNQLPLHELGYPLRNMAF